MSCSRCGKPMNAQAAFCMQCGAANAARGTVRSQAAAMAVPARTVQFSARAQAASAGARGGAATALWILGALACVLAAGVGVHHSGLLPGIRNAAMGTGGPKATPALDARGQASPIANLQAQGASMPDGGLRLNAEQAARNLLEASGAGNEPPLLAASGAGTPPLLEARGNDTPPTLSRQAGMPGDIRAYLEHVRRCDAQRSQMAASQVADAVGLLTELQGANMPGLFDEDGPPVEKAQPARRVTDTASAMRGPWEGLLNQFNGVQPPVECAAIRSYYDQVIRETGLMILEINRAVALAQNDRQHALRLLMGMQGKSASRIDRPARETDALIQSLCAKYDTRKWFDISGDIGAGMLR